MIAIHHRPGSFSDRWIEYCRRKNIPHKLVDCYRSDIIEDLKDCIALMWNIHQENPKDIQFAKQLLYSLQAAGKVVFPDFHTVWHFDDKVGQKYLLEAIGTPFVTSYAFYDKKTALNWAASARFPKVFKLRGGAASHSVRLVRDQRAAKRLIRRAFRYGFSPFNRFGYLKENWRKYRLGLKPIRSVVGGLIRLVYSTKFARVHGRDRGYIYFQDFIPDNSFDIRVIVIGDRAFAIKRMVRENDFRASGSGIITYQRSEIDPAAVLLAFETNDRLKTQCLAYDFVFQDGHPFIVEVSYAFVVSVYDKCEGYWDRDMNWHQEPFNPQEWMVDLVLDQIGNTSDTSDKQKILRNHTIHTAISE